MDNGRNIALLFMMGAVSIVTNSPLTGISGDPIVAITLRTKRSTEAARCIVSYFAP